MSYTQMNAKFSTVENTIVTKGDILTQANLPQLSNKYQILRGYVSFGSAGQAAGTYSVVNELTGQPMVLSTGTYIDKVIAYSGASASSSTALAGSGTVKIGLASSATTTPANHFMFGSTITVDVPAETETVVPATSVNQGDPSTGALSANNPSIANLQAGMSCHPDFVVGSSNIYVTSTTSATVTGLLNVLIFVACP